MPVPGINYYVLLIWLLFFAYWTSSAIYDFLSGKYKKIEKLPSFARVGVDRITLGLAIVIVVTTPLNGFYPFSVIILQSSAATTYFGLGLGLLGVLFAIWARRTLGGNWSSDVVLKKGHTLTTNGPYAIVRNPIYSGVTLGIVGSAISVGYASGLVAIASVLIFSYSRINAENKLMEQRFGKEFDKYRKKVKAFIPWLI